MGVVNKFLDLFQLRKKETLILASSNFCFTARSRVRITCFPSYVVFFVELFHLRCSDE